MVQQGGEDSWCQQGVEDDYGGQHDMSMGMGDGSHGRDVGNAPFGRGRKSSDRGNMPLGRGAVASDGPKGRGRIASGRGNVPMGRGGMAMDRPIGREGMAMDEPMGRGGMAMRGKRFGVDKWRDSMDRGMDGPPMGSGSYGPMGYDDDMNKDDRDMPPEANQSDNNWMTPKVKQQLAEFDKMFEVWEVSIFLEL